MAPQRRTVLTASAIAVAAAIAVAVPVAATAQAPHATPVAAPAGVAAVAPAAAASAPSSHSTHYKQYLQKHDYDCAPWATKGALSTFKIYPTAVAVGKKEHTSSSSGTNSIKNVTAAMNYYLKQKNVLLRYKSVFPKGSTATVKKYLVSTVWGEHGMVANVVGYQTDVDGKSRGYGSGGHYVAVVAYRKSGAEALISDPGNGKHYWMTTSHLTKWIGGSRGISATP